MKEQYGGFSIRPNFLFSILFLWLLVLRKGNLITKWLPYLNKIFITWDKKVHLKTYQEVSNILFNRSQHMTSWRIDRYCGIFFPCTIEVSAGVFWWCVFPVKREFRNWIMLRDPWPEGFVWSVKNFWNFLHKYFWNHLFQIPWSRKKKHCQYSRIFSRPLSSRNVIVINKKVS